MMMLQRHRKKTWKWGCFQNKKKTCKLDLASYFEISDKAKCLDLIPVSILNRRRQDGKARMAAVPTGHRPLGHDLHRPPLWGCAQRNHSNALWSMDLMPAAPELDAAKPVLLDPEFSPANRHLPAVPCQPGSDLRVLLQLVLASLLPLRFLSSYTQPQTGNQSLITDCSLTSHTWTGQPGPWNGSLILWSALPASNSLRYYQDPPRMTQTKLQKYAWSTEMEEFLCPWEKKTRTYLLDFMGILVTVFHMKLLTTARKTTITRSYVLSGKYYL